MWQQWLSLLLPKAKTLCKGDNSKDTAETGQKQSLAMKNNLKKFQAICMLSLKFV
jgi:hypothetical protein